MASSFVLSGDSLIQESDGDVVVQPAAKIRCAVCSTDTDGTKTCSFRQVGWRFFFPNCPKVNFLCSAKRGAYVPVITVCNQALF